LVQLKCRYYAGILRGTNATNDIELFICSQVLLNLYVQKKAGYEVPSTNSWYKKVHSTVELFVSASIYHSSKNTELGSLNVPVVSIDNFSEQFSFFLSVTGKPGFS